MATQIPNDPNSQYNKLLNLMKQMQAQSDPFLYDPFNSISSTTPMNPSKLKAAGGSSYSKGDRVVLMKIDMDRAMMADKSNEANPVWGKDGNYIAGEVRVCIGSVIAIQWDNGFSNKYELQSRVSITHLSEVEHEKKRNVKLDTTAIDAVVMKDETRQEIIAVLKQHQHRAKLFEEWGLGEVIEYGRGMTFMFYGNPGTGKTWCANAIAKALGTTLLTINAADIQTSEPGGANRNIQNAFSTAKSNKQVLFLDECDSLITVRNEVGMILSSEINTLLTEIEKFEGVCILATNRIGTMDEALERRIALIVEFPEPDFDMRLKIWQKMIPKKMPLGGTVKLEKLAEEKLTGGQIKNAVLQSARLALADDANEVNLGHFEKAIKRIHASRSLMGKGSFQGRAKIVQDYVKTSA